MSSQGISLDEMSRSLQSRVVLISVPAIEGGESACEDPKASLTAPCRTCHQATGMAEEEIRDGRIRNHIKMDLRPSGRMNVRGKRRNTVRAYTAVEYFSTVTPTNVASVINIDVVVLGTSKIEQPLNTICILSPLDT
jgi:hypothetical protein